MMREARVGDSRFSWSTCDQEHWCRSADVMIRIADRFGIIITYDGKAADPDDLPSDVYSVIGNNPGTERLVRRDGDRWAIVSRDRKSNDEKVILTFDMHSAEILADRVLAGDPTARDEPAALTQLAAALLTRIQHADP
jgi:hypothetical protein